MPHAEDLSITSKPDERSIAVSECVKQLLADRPDLTQEQASAMCVNQADRAMGTRENLTR